MSAVSTWSTTAASNNSAAPNGAPEGMNPSDVNNCIREIMAAIATWRTALDVTTIELGHASDTTLSRSSAGVLSIEGVVIPTVSSTSTLTNKTLKDYGVAYQAHGNTGATETIDLENGNVHGITLDANCTLTFSNPFSSGTYGEFRLIVTQDGTGSRTITWPSSVDWNSGLVPTLSTGAADIDVLDFFTVDGGTTWIGQLTVRNAS